MEIEFAAVGMTGKIGSLNLNLTLGIAARLGLAPSVCTCTQNFEIDSIRTLVLFVIASFLFKFLCIMHTSPTQSFRTCGGILILFKVYKTCGHESSFKIPSGSSTSHNISGS